VLAPTGVVYWTGRRLGRRAPSRAREAKLNTEPPTGYNLLHTPGAATDNWTRDYVWQAAALRLGVASIPGLVLGGYLGSFSMVVIGIAIIVGVMLILYALDAAARSS
jgi:hypothetical protein